MTPRGLWRARGMRMCEPMRILLLALLLTPMAAAAQSRPPAKPAPTANAPKSLGKFDDWQGATFNEGGQTVCYAFTRARASTPAISGRGEVLLTVTHRPAVRDAVSLSAGFNYATGAAVSLQADGGALEFYVAQRSAFARDGKASVASLQKTAGQKNATATMKSQGPKNVIVSDSFSLKGFTAAYAAIGRACPAK